MQTFLQLLLGHAEELAAQPGAPAQLHTYVAQLRYKTEHHESATSDMPAYRLLQAAKGDVYGWACMMLELFCPGQHPFEPLSDREPRVFAREETFILYAAMVSV